MSSGKIFKKVFFIIRFDQFADRPTHQLVGVITQQAKRGIGEYNFSIRVQLKYQVGHPLHNDPVKLFPLYDCILSLLEFKLGGYPANDFLFVKGF